jgi:hypothetical protein
VVTNCILWANSAVNEGDEIFNDDCYPSFMYCDIGGSGGSAGWDSLLGIDGGNNIDVDPMLVLAGYWDPNGTAGDPDDDFWVDGDYHLLEDSECIDSGDPNYILDPNYPTDLDGNPRVVNGVVDMGAYEVQPDDPIALLHMLIDDVIESVQHDGITKSLLAKLDTAIGKLEDGNDKNNKAAINSIKAFINAVEAQHGNKISEEDADNFIALAQQILDLLSSE